MFEGTGSDHEPFSQLPYVDLNEIEFSGRASFGNRESAAFQLEAHQRVNQALEDHRRPGGRGPLDALRPGTAEELYQRLSRHVIGNEEVLRAVSAVGFNHLKRTGAVVSVLSVQYALQHEAMFRLETNQELDFLYAVTREIRRFDLDMKRGNPLRDALRALVDLGEERKLIKSLNNARMSVEGILDALITITRSQCEDLDESRLDKTNILLIGGTGTGKTLIAHTLASALKVPYLAIDANTFSRAGYVGDDVRDSICQGLLTSAGGDHDRAGRGVVRIDEIDKKRARSGEDREASGAGVQEALLVPTESYSDPVTGVDTTQVLFLATGAFNRLEQIIARRLNPQSIGFSASRTDSRSSMEVLRQVNAADLIEYGIIPELVGRFSRILVTDEVSEASLRSMLVDSASSPLRTHLKLSELDGMRLEIDPAACDAIAREAFNRRMGGRSLKAICDVVFEDLHLSASQMDHRGAVVRITEGYVTKKLKSR